MNEIKRVHGVLDGHLATRKWLVGDKCTYADLAFITWQETAVKLSQEHAGYFDTEKDFPHVAAWMKRMADMPRVGKLLQEREEKMAALMAARK